MQSLSNYIVITGLTDYDGVNKTWGGDNLTSKQQKGMVIKYFLEQQCVVFLLCGLETSSFAWGISLWAFKEGEVNKHHCGATK